MDEKSLSYCYYFSNTGERRHSW